MSEQHHPEAGASASPDTHSALDRLNSVIDRLIAPDGCPWDREQTPQSLTEYLVEECHELVDAIRSGKASDVCEELGDVAFQLLFLGRLFADQGGPSLADALNASADKMIRRHPHVFGDTAYSDRDAQLKDWERIKREEKAADQGDEEAQYNLGVCYITGQGVQPNRAVAGAWLKEAAARGNESAVALLKQLGD